MSSRSDIDFLVDIREAIYRVEVYLEGMDYEKFMADLKTQDAVVRNLEIIGEATKNLSEELRTDHSEIPWRGLAGIRDKLIHHYFGVNFDIVWQVAKEELPQIKLQLEEIL